MRSLIPRFKISDCSVTSFRLGKNRRRDLFFAWLTLLPVIGPFPVSSQRRAISVSLLNSICPPATIDYRAGGRPLCLEWSVYCLTRLRSSVSAWLYPHKVGTACFGPPSQTEFIDQAAIFSPNLAESGAVYWLWQTAETAALYPVINYAEIAGLKRSPEYRVRQHPV